MSDLRPHLPWAYPGASFAPPSVLVSSRSSRPPQTITRVGPEADAVHPASFRWQAYFPAGEGQQAQHARYFDLLSRANTPMPSGRASPAASSTSRIKRFFSPSAPASDDEEDEDDRQPSSSTRPSMAGARASSSSSSSETNSGADGYYGRFFVERQRLGESSRLSA